MEWRYLSFDGDSRDGGEHGSQLSPCHRGVASSHPATTKPGQVGNAPRAWEYSVERIRQQFGSTPIGQQHKSVASSGAQPRVVPASGVAMAIAGLVVAKVNDSKVDPLVVRYGCPTESSLLALHSHQGIVPTQVAGCRVVKAKLPPPRILSGSVVVLGRLLHPPRRQGVNTGGREVAVNRQGEGALREHVGDVAIADGSHFVGQPGRLGGEPGLGGGTMEIVASLVVLEAVFRRRGAVSAVPIGHRRDDGVAAAGASPDADACSVHGFGDAAPGLHRDLEWCAHDGGVTDAQYLDGQHPGEVFGGQDEGLQSARSKYPLGSLREALRERFGVAGTKRGNQVQCGGGVLLCPGHLGSTKQGRSQAVASDDIPTIGEVELAYPRRQLDLANGG